jgi:prepilin-type N-terminal cleavage/methylation domain-containing protein
MMIAARPRGFTLLEVLLSVALIGVLAGISLPIYNSFLARNDLDITAQQVAESFRRAQIYSRGMKDDFAWGVNIQPTSVILFRGTNFATRNTAYDEPISLPGITASGLSEVQFAKLTGLPNTTGTVTLTTNNGQTKQVVINAQGMVNY